ncbi:MAG TPA: SDR family oxidoreductase [Fibrobacteria bacterium]|nr:SDR family oxidoreductase [Fibrobacteria bacterium]
MKILVTGANGHFGSKVVEYLLATVPPRNVAVSVREPEKAEGFKAAGVEVRYGDFEDPDSLPAAFSGIDRLLIISVMGDNETRTRQHLNAVAAAKRAQVGYLAYTSAAKADTTTLWLAEVHRTTESAILRTGIPFTLLRNNWYIENELGLIQSILAGEPLATSAGSGRVSWAPRHEYALAAANVLLGSGHENKTYELSGPSATYRDMAATLSRILGREVSFLQVNDTGLGKAMGRMGVPQDMVPFAVGIHAAIRQGALEVKSKDFETLIRKPVTPLKAQLEAVLESLGVHA